MRPYNCHLPVSGGFACRSPPRYLAGCRVVVVSPEGAWPGRTPQVTPGLVGTRSPSPGIQQGDRWLSHVPESPLCRHAPLSDPGGVLDTRHNASRTAAFRRLHTVGFPFDPTAGYPLVHDYTHLGAPSRGLPSRYTRLRTAPCGEARGCATDLLARLSSGGMCTGCAPTGKHQPIAWVFTQFQGFGLTLARARLG